MKHSLLFLALLATLVQPAAAATPAGIYRLNAGPDVASQIEISDSGRFAYFLSAGAMDEHAEGRWTREGKILRLTTEPEPKPAEFRAVAAKKTDEAPFTLLVTAPDGRGIAGVDFRIGFDRGDPIESYTQEYGWSAPSTEHRKPAWVELAVPMYGLASQRFALSLQKGNVFSFTLIPNDLGVADFDNLPLTIEDGQLVMHRNGGELVYEKVKASE